MVQRHTSERTSKRGGIGVAGAPRVARTLGVSSSLPGHVSPSQSGDSLESSSTYGCPIVVRSESRVTDLPSLRLGAQNGRDRDRNDPFVNTSGESVSVIGFSNTRKMRVMHSPRSTTATSLSASASSSSSRCSSPKGSNKTAASTNGNGGKAEIKNRNRVRVTKEHDDDSQHQNHEQRHEQESKSGLKEYQLAGVSRKSEAIDVKV